MGEACYTCDYCHREYNEIVGWYLYFCKKLRKSVLWSWHCGFYKHDIMSPEEQQLQDTMDKLSNEICSQLGIPKWKAESAVNTAIRAYDDFIQKEFRGEKVNDN